MSSLFGALALAIARDPALLAPGVGAAEVRALVSSVRPNLGFYVALIVLAASRPGWRPSASWSRRWWPFCVPAATRASPIPAGGRLTPSG